MNGMVADPIDVLLKFRIPHSTFRISMQHLYLHVPFCSRRCSYCDFAIAVRREVPAGEYVEAIRRELDLLGRGKGDEGRVGPLETIYLGGGTPSKLPADAVNALLRTLSSYASFSTTLEVTLEANPEEVTPESAAAWQKAGINRVSLGAQTFDDTVLRWMHRTHDAASIGQAVRLLRQAGIDNISLDLIFALPETLHRDWGRDLDQLVTLHPSHVSIYGLTVEPRTPLARWISRGATVPSDDDRYADEYLTAHERLGAAGYQFYEVSNASLPGLESRHNSAYWTGAPYLGLGPSAHSFDGRARRWNLPAWEAYRRAISEGRSAIESEEILTDEQRRLEALYLGLRTRTGISLTASTALTALTARGWLLHRDSRVACTPEGWLRLDDLVKLLAD